ncbi:MAG: calcium/sodium antiporter [Methanocellales archaeon]|nr:calcium/sodium antiporter [Methanocellales archaeon]MDD3291313.1 calcium/sodium antiporter [Methanocellales archaeon]MDD5235807.1 calcium/sodium antiporter [Methanocellales archaeon]MDD5484432.1 calcium/sodium antiporter [Methanocellales archaeon]
MLEYLGLILGLALLYKGADYLVDASSSLAKRLGISSLVIGLTIVAFGTSMPELIVNVYSSFQGNADIAYGNIVGSNICNVLVILGIAALLMPLKVQSSTVWKEIPFALIAALTLFAMSNEAFFNLASTNSLTRTDGVVLLFFFMIFLYYVFGLTRSKQGESAIGVEVHKHKGIILFFMMAGGFAALYVGGRLTVDSAVNIARQFGISELLISSTIVAVGTSLPELVTSFMAALKKEMDLSVGNVIGSNIFNISFIMGVSAVISPLAVPVGINFDFIVLIIATILLFIFMFSGTKRRLDRWEGMILLLLYVVYIAVIVVRG